MSQANYRSMLRAPVRGLWSGVLSFDQFFESMQNAIELGLTQAWTAGARSVGIAPEDRTPQEQMQLNNVIVKEGAYIAGLGEFVESKRRELQEPGSIKASLSVVYSRVERWVTRWLDVFNQGVLTGRDDPKLKWLYNHLKQHCGDCKRLHGKVKRKSTWDAAGLRPQSPDLS